jgi:hypothetical protein
MRFMMIVKAKEGQGLPPQALMDAIARSGEEQTKAGRMLSSGGLYPTATGHEVRLSNGKVTVTDGPFTETKEVFGGFAIFELPSKEEALASAKAFMDLHEEYWPGWEGTTEVRQMFEAPDFSSAEKAVPCAEPAKATV